MKNTFVALLTIILLAVSPVAFAAECPLCKAVGNGNLSEVKRLLDNGADVNYENKHGLAVLDLAAFNGYSEVVKLLLDNGADVNYENKNGNTALIAAVIFNQNKVAKVLLDNGANVNYENKNGTTALIVAVIFNKNKVAKVLLECGANPDIKNKDGKNTWDFAEGKRIILAILEKHLNDVVEGREFPPCDKTATN